MSISSVKPNPIPSAKYLPTWSLNNLDGDLIPKKDLKPPTIESPTFLIVLPIFFTASNSPFVIPSKIFLPIDSQSVFVIISHIVLNSFGPISNSLGNDFINASVILIIIIGSFSINIGMELIIPSASAIMI